MAKLNELKDIYACWEDRDSVNNLTQREYEAFYLSISSVMFFIVCPADREKEEEAMSVSLHTLYTGGVCVGVFAVGI